METTSKTAEKIKSFVDQVDSRVQELEHDIKDLVHSSKQRYHQELEKIKQLADETKDEIVHMHQERVQKAKDSFDETTMEARSFMETKLEPLNNKVSILKEAAVKYTDRTEERWQEIKKETEDLLETTKLAVHNFKETFRAPQDS